MFQCDDGSCIEPKLRLAVLYDFKMRTNPYSCRNPYKKHANHRLPDKSALDKSAPVKSAPVKSAPVKSAPVKSAPVKSAPVKSAPVKSAPVKSAPVKSPQKTQSKAPQSKAPQLNASQDLIALISSHELIKCLGSMLGIEMSIT